MLNSLTIIDNGSHNLKIGLIDDFQPNHFPNYKIKQKNSNSAGLFSPCRIIRPFTKDLMTNISLQKSIWTDAISRLNSRSAESPLLITIPPLNPKTVSSSICKMAFEELGVPSLSLKCGQKFAPLSVKNPSFNANCCVVVDVGFSSVFVVPVVFGTTLNYAVQKVSSGGRLLVETLKESISFRQFDIRENFLLAEDIMRRCCHLSTDFKEQMGSFRKGDDKVHVALPDGGEITAPILFRHKAELEENVVRAEPQVITLGMERISVPELILHPSNAGGNQAGLAESIFNSIGKTPVELRETLFENILLIGGTSQFDNISKRLKEELKGFSSETQKIRIFKSENPINAVWNGAKKFVLQTEMTRNFISKREFEEGGSEYCLRKLNFQN